MSTALTNRSAANIAKESATKPAAFPSSFARHTRGGTERSRYAVLSVRPSAAPAKRAPFADSNKHVPSKRA